MLRDVFKAHLLIVLPLETSMKHFAVMSVEILWFLIIPAQAFSTRALMSPPVMALAAAPTSSMAVAAPSPTLGPRQGCPAMCGGVHIPYPFGIGSDCAWNGTESIAFTINCNHSFSPPRPYTGDFEIINISMEAGEMRVFSPVSYTCTTTSPSQNNTKPDNGVVGWSLDFSGTPFLISSSRNVFTGIGCDTLAFIGGRDDLTYFTGCISSCESLQDAAQNGEDCTGLGCCKTDIPGNLNTVTISWGTGNDTNANPAWSPCSYAFVGENGWYHFNREDLSGVGNMSFTHRVGDRTIPVVLDWAIRTNGSCQMPEGQTGPPTASACLSNHSFCVDARQGPGYLCNCSKGYEGNPYLIGGCTDINECELQKSNPCGAHTNCHNTPGDYMCKCKFGYRGDGKSATGCHPIIPGYAIAIFATLLATVLACLALALLIKRKQRKCFKENGGDILKGMGINIFTQGDLKKITKTYSNLIGTGYFGKVYKGIMDMEGVQAQEVAVKCTVAKNVVHQRQKSLQRNVSPVEQESSSWKDGFVREITFQFQIHHPNVVRLVGCCLETDVPILVFEYVSNGSLHDKLHGAAEKKCTLSLLQRLDIAIGSAQALSHIHNHGEYNHVHGDVKPDNILLDSDLKAKVSDFGSSKLLSVNRYAVDVPADRMYADPVYYKTGRFTTKSDVYSFGVVLLELITGKTPRYGGTNGGEILTVDFKKACKTHGNGRKMYDAYISGNNEDALSHPYMDCLDMVGALAVQCLSEDVDERPTMAEVVKELEQVKSIASGGSCSPEAI